MDDLSEDDMITMRTGASMILGKDSAGRGILFTSVKYIQAKTYDNQVGTDRFATINSLSKLGSNMISQFSFSVLYFSASRKLVQLHEYVARRRSSEERVSSVS